MDEYYSRVKGVSESLNAAFQHKKEECMEDKTKIISMHPTVAWRLHEYEVKEKWKKIVGPMISNAVVSMYLKGKIFTVKVNSSVVRNELISLRSQMVERLNQEMGKNVISDVVIC